MIHLFPKTEIAPKRNAWTGGHYAGGNTVERPHPFYYMTAFREGETETAYIERVAREKAAYDFWDRCPPGWRMGTPSPNAIAPKAEHYRWACDCWDKVVAARTASAS